ncbi:MAG: hypothetical protein JXR48_04515 [Candidatus Delongbacteria bacterium]|nr:hypothetical protein [Candidatus Delongbacteria bacterium]MBN2834211.1 hypothetical protein [Candidatus Delongbacteria bacterium]
MKNYVYYACYGSNLSYNRFMCYIKGGVPEGSAYNFNGAHDKSEPEESFVKKYKGIVKFAGCSPVWNNGGVCYYNPYSDSEVLFRLYKITYDQFKDIVLQENKTDYLNFPKYSDLKNYTNEYVLANLDYGKLLEIDIINNYPVLTFTSPKIDELILNRPVKPYLLKLIEGLLSNGLKKEVISSYLSVQHGIEYNYDEIRAMMED